MKTTRQHILDYIERKGTASSREIASAMHLTAANIRHHLEILVEEGALQVTGQRRDSVRGRPGKLYSLKSLASQHNLDCLASALLSGTLEALQEEQRNQICKDIAGRLAEARTGSAMNKASGTPAHNRLQKTSQKYLRAAEQLNAMNYQARWEARPDSPRMILGHCPYLSILPDHPELCTMDAYLLERMLGGKADQIAKLALTPQGLRQCVFVIQQEQEKPL